MNRTFTDAFIRKLQPKAKPYKRAEEAPRGEGRLMVRVQPSGAKEFFYRYRNGGRDSLLSLGRYDHTGVNGKTLAQIRHDQDLGLAAIRQRQRATGDVKADIRAKKRARSLEQRRGTFAQLLAVYVANLRNVGKTSADRVEAIFRRNVLTPFPELAAEKASAITPDDIGSKILARMVNRGIKRQVNMTRAYLRAAFAHGGKQDHDPRTLAREGVLFGLTANPVVMVPIVREYENTRDRALTEDELRLFWKATEEIPQIHRATLRLNLALACQRPTQVLRADWQAFDLGEKTLLLKDSKGRGGIRDHLLPLTPFALEQLKPLRDMNGDAPMPFTTDGKRALTLETLSAYVAAISEKLEKSHGVPAFQLRDLRRTAETMLQKLGVDKEVRAHLLSHGRTHGVQGKHYERYDFLPEKRAALEKWARHLDRIITGKAAKVVAIKGAAA